MTDQQPTVMNGFQRLLEVGLLLAGAVSIYILITLFTFDPADPSWSKTGNYEMIKNAGGAFGAWLADILLFSFGYLAFFVPVLVALFGWLMFRKFHNLIEIDYLALGLRVIGFFLFVIGLSAICSVNFDDIYYFSSGGIVGDVFAYLLMPLFGFTGSTLLFLVSLMVGTTLMTGISWMQVVDGIGKYTIMSCLFVYNKLSRRDVVPNPIAKETKHDGSDNVKADSDEIAKEQTDKTELSNSIDLEKITEPTPIKNQSEDNSEDKSKTSASLLNQFFGSADVPSEDRTATQNRNTARDIEETVTVPEYHEEALQESQAASLITPEPALDTTASMSAKDDKSSKAAVSLDDDMPFSIEEFEQQSSNSTLDEAIADDDISGALSSLHAAQKDMPKRDTVATVEVEPVKPKEPITLPSLELLDRADKEENPISPDELEAVSRLVEAKLLDFNIQAQVVGVYPGPVITRFELDLAPGIKVSKISGLSKDLARSLSAMSVRVVEVIPGKSYIGLEIPNKHRQIVRLSEVMDSNGFQNSSSPLTMVLGKDIAGKAVVVDLAKMPHLLVAGTTGSGKSVGVNTMILSLLYKSTPEDVRLIMIDPKMLELSVYEGIPHLLSEVVTDMKEAANALRWCVGEMERRYKLMSAMGVRNLKGFNTKVTEAIEAGNPLYDPLWKDSDDMLERPPQLEKLPAIVVVIDEFADMMMIVGKKVEELIARIAQKARAAGIHLVLATQRPSVDVITGLIKANIPTRMAFQVSSKIDSRTILDQQGAENLLGMGDMLYLPPGSGVPTRVHGAFVDDHEVHAVVSDWKSKAKPNYIAEILQGEMTEENMLPGEAAEMAEGEEVDPVFDEAVAFVTETRKVSISSIQRKLRIGYNRSARIVEQMEMMGIVSTAAHNGTREVLAPPPVKEEGGEEMV